MVLACCTASVQPTCWTGQGLGWMARNGAREDYEKAVENFDQAGWGQGLCLKHFEAEARRAMELTGTLVTKDGAKAHLVTSPMLIASCWNTTKRPCKPWSARKKRGRPELATLRRRMAGEGRCEAHQQGAHRPADAVSGRGSFERQALQTLEETLIWRHRKPRAGASKKNLMKQTTVSQAR